MSARREPRPPDDVLTGQAVDAIHGEDHGRFFWFAEVLHEVRVFRRVVVEIVQDARGPEAGFAEEELGSDIRFADLERDPRAALARELADELVDHLAADAAAAEVGGDGEIED